jgi:hypothetical protein
MWEGGNKGFVEAADLLNCAVSLKLVKYIYIYSLSKKKKKPKSLLSQYLLSRPCYNPPSVYEMCN